MELTSNLLILVSGLLFVALTGFAYSKGVGRLKRRNANASLHERSFKNPKGITMTMFKPWNSNQLAEVSMKRAGGYCPGASPSHPEVLEQANRWTPEQLEQFGDDLTRGYGAGK
mgnify:CR=1 FL=1|jgi:hypothetical protein